MTLSSFKSIIRAMKAFWASVLLLVLACSSRKSDGWSDDRFLGSLVDINATATVSMLTSDGRSIYPLFSPGDSIVFFKRLLITEPSDTFTYQASELVKPYGININNGELYTLSSDYEYPSSQSLDPSLLPRRYAEKTVWGLKSPAGPLTAFETVTDSKEETHLVYLTIGDSIEQITYGKISCFIDRFSNTGRYLSIIYGRGPTWILIYDINRKTMYRISRHDELVDYMTWFNTDDSAMLFVRSDKNYRLAGDYFGDLGLVKFKHRESPAR